MKGSARKMELSSEQEEPSDAVEPTQADLGLESYGVQDQRDVGEGSVQAASGAMPQSVRAGSGLEPCSFLDIELGTTQGNCGVAVQPTQAGLGLESHSSQEQPKAEEVAIQADSGVAVQLTQAGSRLEFQNFQEQPNVEEGAIQPIRRVVVQPMQTDLGAEPQTLQEQPSVEERGAHAVQPTQVALPNPSYFEPISIEDLHVILHTRADDEEHEIIEEILQLVTGQGEASHQEEEAGINDRIVPQDPPSDMNNLRNVQAETYYQTEEAAINDRVVPQAPPLDRDNFRSDGLIEAAGSDEPVDDEEDIGIQARAVQQQVQDGPPQQGTAGRRMRLQVPLCVSIASSERNCMCGGMPLRYSLRSKKPSFFLRRLQIFFVWMKFVRLQE